MPDEGTNTNTQTQTTPPPAEEIKFDEWLGKQPENIRKSYETHNSGLLNSVKATRKERDDALTQVKDLAKKAEKGSELEKSLQAQNPSRPSSPKRVLSLKNPYKKRSRKWKTPRDAPSSQRKRQSQRLAARIRKPRFYWRLPKTCLTARGTQIGQPSNRLLLSYSRVPQTTQPMLEKGQAHNLAQQGTI
jgi:hypothetical protein